MKWTAREIARSLHWQVFDQRHLIVLPNTSWTGSEADMLLVRTDLRLMEVEIKISRSDLKADAKKEKWWEGRGCWEESQGRGRKGGGSVGRHTPVARTHPLRIWKHYYCLPNSIWSEDLLGCIPTHSGIILLRDHHDRPGCWLRRQARPAKDAARLTLNELVDIARVQSTRMWASFDEVDRRRRVLVRPRQTTDRQTDRQEDTC